MGIVAAAVVGEVLLRVGEVGSVVPTKVPGNLERRVGGACLSTLEPPSCWGEVPTCPTKHRSRPRPRRQDHLATYMAPWELAA